MPSGNDGLGREVDGGDHAPGDMDVAVLIVGRGARRRGKDNRIRCLGGLAVGGNIAMAGHIHRWSGRSNYSHTIAIEHFSHKGRAQSTPWAS